MCDTLKKLKSIYRNDNYIRITGDEEYFVVWDNETTWSARTSDLAPEVLEKVESMEGSGKPRLAYEKLCESVEPIDDIEVLRDVKAKLGLDRLPKVNW